MLLNWFVSSAEANSTRNISNSQELRTLGIQYCTHLLAAGVLRQISDKEAPTEKVFKPNLMYYWAHMEPTVAQPLTPGRLHTTTWPPQKETYQSQQYYSVNNNEEITDITEAKLIIADLKRKLQDLVHQLENYKENSIGVINNKNLNGNKSLQVVERQKLELISREVQTNNISNDNSHMSDKSVITTSKPDSILKTNVDNGLNVELSKFNYDERCTHAIKEEPEQRSVKIENYCKLNKSRECNLSLRKDTSLEHIEKRINSDIVTNKLEKQHINETQKNNRLSNNIQNFVSDSSSDASYVSTTTDVMGNQSMMGDDRIPFRSLSPPTSQVLYAKPDNYQFASNLSSLELTQSEQSWKSIESEKSEASSDLISENVTTIDIEAEQSLPKLESPSIKQSELEMKIYIPKEISGTVEKLESPTTVSPSSLVPLDTSSKPFTTTVVRSQPPPMPGMSPSPPPTPGTNQSTTLCRIHANELVKDSSMKESLASTVSEGPPNISLLPDIATFEDQQPTLPPIPTTHIPLPPSLQSDVNATSPPTMSSMEAIPPPPPMLPMEPTSQNTPNLGPSPPPMSSIGIPSSSMSSMGPPPPPMPGMGPPPPPMPGMGPPPPPPPMPGMGPPPPPMPGMGPPPPPPMPGMGPPPMPGMGPPPPPPMPGMGPPPPPPMPGMGPPPMPGMGPPPPPPMPGMGPPPPPPMPGMGPPPPPPMPGMGPPPPPMPGMGPPPPPMPGMGPPPPPLPGMGPPPPPPILGMGPPPPPMAGFGPPPPPIPGVSAPGIPPTPSGPTPFPAPPVGGWSMQRATLRKPPIKPAAPMKPLYWTRILATTSIRTGQGEADTGFKPLWLEIDETRLDNIDEFMDLFSRQVVKAPVKKKVEVKTKIQPIKILDSKRSQNVGILAQSLHIEFSEIENAIYNFDTSVVSLEALQQIYELRATSEELAMIKEHLKSKSDIPLDKPEAFLHDLSGIPNFAERISCFMFQAEFEDAVNTTMHKLDNLKHTCEFLMNNESLKQLFAIILTLGNYMNGGNGQRGQADGFGLEILSKLKDVKSKQSTVTLLHFIVKTYMRQRGGALSEECALPVPEPGDVLRAAALDFADVAAGLATLRAQLEGCKEKMKKVVEAGSTSNHPDVAVGPENNKRLEVFKDKMTTFIDAAEEKLKTEDENLSECRNKFISTVRFYQYTPKCGKVEDCEPKEFFSLWTSFCSDFKDIYKKEEQLAVKEKLKETKKLHEVRKAQTVTQPKKEGGLKARLQKLSSVRK